MSPTRGLQPARHGPVASRQSTRRLLRERSLQPLALYVPVAPAARSAPPPLTPYALAARSLRSRRSLHTIPPLALLPTRPNTL